MCRKKLWDGEPFWGLGYEWDPEWVLTDRQKELRDLLIELSREGDARERQDFRRQPRVPAAESGTARRARIPGPDSPGGIRRLRRGPRRLLDGLRDDRPLRLRVHGDVLCHAYGRGQRDHAASHRREDRQVHPAAQQREDRDAVLLGPGDRKSFLVPFSSGAERSNGGYKVKKKASWTTSGGFADFYVVQTTSPDFSGYDDLIVFVVDGEDAHAQPAPWDALGLRGNQSGPIRSLRLIPA